MIRYASVETARESLRFWGGDAGSVQHIGDSASSVFEYTRGPERCVLKLTDVEFRTRDSVMAELEFVVHLHQSGVAVAEPVRALGGDLVVEVANGSFVACSTVFVDGPSIKLASDATQALVTAWGRGLGELHAASRRFVPVTAARRSQWHEDPWVANALDLIPRNDEETRNEFRTALAAVSSIAATPETYGLNHGDHGPQNFRFDRAANRIISFDFGNCCYHYFLNDLAVALSTFRRHEKRDAMKNWLLEAYAQVTPLAEDADERLEWLLRLRVIYVYISRLFMFGPDPTPDQLRTLASMRARVLERKGW